MIEDSSSQNESFLTIDYAWFMTHANRPQLRRRINWDVTFNYMT